MFSSPPQKTFRYTFSWCIAAGVFFFPLLIWAGYQLNQTRRINPVLQVFCAIFGVLFAYAWLWMKRTTVTLHDEGISYKSPFSQKDLRWDEITETRYGQQSMNLAVHFGLIGLLLALRSGNNKVIRSLELIGPRKIVINSNIRDLEELVRLVLAAVNPRLRREAERMLNSGGTVSFGKISLSSTGVIWKSKEPIPYASIVKCKIDGSMLRVKAEGKWLDNIAVGVKKIPNVFLLLDLIEEKRSALQGKTAPALAGSSAHQYLA